MEASSDQQQQQVISRCRALEISPSIYAVLNRIASVTAFKTYRFSTKILGVS
jgi:hypothetical protein